MLLKLTTIQWHYPNLIIRIELYIVYLQSHTGSSPDFDNGFYFSYEAFFLIKCILILKHIRIIRNIKFIQYFRRLLLETDCRLFVLWKTSFFLFFWSFYRNRNFYFSLLSLYLFSYHWYTFFWNLLILLDYPQISRATLH